MANTFLSSLLFFFRFPHVLSCWLNIISGEYIYHDPLHFTQSLPIDFFDFSQIQFNTHHYCRHQHRDSLKQATTIRVSRNECTKDHKSKCDQINNGKHKCVNTQPHFSCINLCSAILIYLLIGNTPYVYVCACAYAFPHVYLLQTDDK